MKYEVASIRLRTPHNGDYRARSLRVGEWHAHLSLEGGGVTVSHACGVSAAVNLSPVRVVRLLRALSAVRYCPVDAPSLRRLVANDRAKKHATVAPWLHEVKRAVDSVILANIEVRP